MIKFLTEEAFGKISSKGILAQFDPETESQLVAQGHAVNYPAVTKPVEVLSSSAVIASCTTTKVDEVLASFTIPASILGVNSVLQIDPLWTFTSSGYLKTLSIRIGGVTVFTIPRYSKTTEAPMVILANRNSLTSQIRPYADNYMSGGVWTPATFTINFAVDQTVEFRGYRESSNDILNLEYYRVLHFVGD